jgi:hypothetical protein
VDGRVQFSLRTLFLVVTACALAILFWRGAALVATFLAVTAPLWVVCLVLTGATERLAKSDRPLVSLSCFLLSASAGALLFMALVFSLTAVLVAISMELTNVY